MRLETEKIRVQEAGIDYAIILSRLHDQSLGGQEGQRWAPAALAEILSMPGTAAILAVDEQSGSDAPLGFAIIRTAADEGEIISIGVVPAARRRGVGSILLDHVLVTAGGAGVVRVFLEVAEDNPGAYSFYRARGFIQSGRRENYYGRDGSDRVHARVLCRELVPGSKAPGKP